MKRFAILIAATAIAACSSEPEPAPEPTETVAALPTVADMAGTYEFTSAEGEAGTSVMTADGAYTDTVGDTVETGTFTVEDGKTCFDPEGDDPAQPIRCFTTTEPDADGNFTATADDGTVEQVKKIS